MIAACLGWLGTAGTFAAYTMLWRGRMTSESLRYAALNAGGGLLAGTASALYGAWPSAVSNFLWAAAGIHSIGRTVITRRAAQRALRTTGTASSLAPAACLGS